MNYLTKRDRINAAFKWREDKRKQSNDELLTHALGLFILIITLCQINYIYNNYNNYKKLEYKDNL
jgi:hypothetical protein